MIQRLGASLVSFISPLAGAISRTLTSKLGEYVSANDFGAKGDGVTDDSAAINAALAASKKVILKPGSTYLIKSSIVISQDDSVFDLNGATILLDSTLLVSGVTATGRARARITGGTVKGTGLANTTNTHLILLSSCTGCQVDNMRVTESPQDGIRMVSCTECIITVIRATNNLVVGVQDRDGTRNIITHVVAASNGVTSQTTGTGGRGILLWRTFDTMVDSCLLRNSTEYGIRVYSQTGDSRGSRGIRISNIHCEDNNQMDVYIYNEIGSVTDITVDGLVIRRSTQPGASVVTLAGARTTFRNANIVKEGDRLTTPTIVLYQATNPVVSGIVGGNLGQVFSFSGTTDANIYDVSADCTIIGIGGTRTKYTNCDFRHGGAGTTDIALNAGTEEQTLDGVSFNGFYRNINWDSQRMTLVNCKSTNTTDVSLRMNGDGIQNLWQSGCRWDTASNPAIVSTIKKDGHTSSKIIAYANAAPTTLTWSVGDRVFNNVPVSGQPQGWGYTGTAWVSMGNFA